MDIGGEDAVLVLHGKYFTTYSNLNGVTVTRGQKVKAGTIVGKVAQGSDGEGQITFMVTNSNGSPLNPEPWLKKR